jgi:hypothetical protein
MLRCVMAFLSSFAGLLLRRPLADAGLATK